MKTLLLISAVATLSSTVNASSLLDFAGQGFPVNSFFDQPDTYGDNLAGTPNIGLTYTNAFYNSAFGPFLDVLTPSRPFGVTAEVAFTPDAGYGVRLLSFQLGIQNFNSTSVLRILDGAGNILLDYAASGAVVISSNPTTFFPNLSQDGTLRLQFGESWYTGVDNIAFEQYDLNPPSGGIPEPSSVFLCLSGFGAILLGARKRSKQSEGSNGR